ncbi:MAG: TraB/GumN family protein [Erythrobacter sp.]|nr:TraB/GumN family protein [Erythrobacter sp.]
MWTVETPSGVVLLVGEIAAVPKATDWQPDRLEEATADTQRVILGVEGKVSPGDILRVIFAGGRIRNLPKGTVAADYLEPGQLARLEALERTYDQDHSRGSFLLTAFDLLGRRLRFNRDTADGASRVVRRAARKADVPTQPVGSVRGEDMLDSLAEGDPRSHIPCLEAAMTAVEIGPELIARRGADWRNFRVPDVMANPLEIALGKCWPWADVDLGGELRQQWVSAIASASREEGATMAVVPLRVLAEEGGVLDQLAAQGFDVAGPDWR